MALWQPEAAWAFAPLAACVALLLICDLVFTRHKKSSEPRPDPYSTPLDPWIAAYLISFFVTLGFKTVHGLYLQELYRTAAFVTVYYAAARFREKTQVIKPIFIGFLVIGGIIAAMALAGVLERDTRGVAGVVLGTRQMRWNFISHVHLTGFLAMVLGMGLGVVLTTKKGWLKPVWIGWIVGLLVVYIAARSRAGWIALGVTGLLTVALLPLPGRKKIWGAAVTLLIAAGTAVALWEHVYARVTDTVRMGVVREIRFDTWRAAVNMLKENWLLGVGPGMFKYDVLSFRPPELDRWPVHAFNHWLEAFSEQGTTVLPFLLGVTAIVFWQSIMRLRSGENAGDRLKAGAAFGLLAVGMHDLFDWGFTVWIIGALACALGGWIQPASKHPQVHSTVNLIRRTSIGVLAALCVVLSCFFGYANRLVWQAGLGGPLSSSQLSVSDRVRLMDQAVRILPGDAGVHRARALFITRLTMAKKGSRSSKWSGLAIDRWRTYFKLNPRDYEARYYLAVAMTVQNGGFVSEEALQQMDIMIRERAGQMLPRMTSARYVLDHLAAGDDRGRRWAEKRIQEISGSIQDVMRSSPDWFDEWKSLNTFYSHWRKDHTQPESVERMRIYFEQNGLDRENFYRWLRTSNLFSYYARYDLQDAGLIVTKPASAKDLAQIRESSSEEITFRSSGDVWEPIGSDAAHIEYRTAVGDVRDLSAGHLIIRASSELCGGDGAYIKVMIGGRVIGGFMINDPVGRDFALTPPGPLPRSDQIELVLVNLNARLRGTCELNCQVHSITWANKIS